MRKAGGLLSHRDDPRLQDEDLALESELPDPDPFSDQPSAKGPRHEHADPEEGSEAIAAQSFGEIIEIVVADTVDGDLNGAPELAGIEQSREWEAADALDAIRRAAGNLDEGDRSTTEMLLQLVDERREVLLERTPEAIALGLGPLFESVAAITGSADGGAPIAVDDDVLREQLSQLDEALATLEAAAIETPGASLPPRSLEPRVHEASHGAGPSAERRASLGRLAALAFGGMLLGRAFGRRGLKR